MKINIFILLVVLSFNLVFTKFIDIENDIRHIHYNIDKTEFTARLDISGNKGTLPFFI